jgi:hypothetical protein
MLGWSPRANGSRSSGPHLRAEAPQPGSAFSGDKGPHGGRAPIGGVPTGRGARGSSSLGAVRSRRESVHASRVDAGPSRGVEQFLPVSARRCPRFAARGRVVAKCGRNLAARRTPGWQPVGPGIGRLFCGGGHMEAPMCPRFAGGCGPAARRGAIPAGCGPPVSTLRGPGAGGREVWTESGGGAHRGGSQPAPASYHSGRTEVAGRLGSCERCAGVGVVGSRWRRAGQRRSRHT